MLKIINLCKSYGTLLAVNNLSLEIKEGEIFGFIGPNGAGKSTTIRAILDFINKDKGEVYIDNQLFDRKNIKLKKIIGYLPSEIHLYEDYVVEEMIKYNQTFYDFDVTSKAIALCNRLELDVNKKIDSLSFGNLKKLGIVLSLMHSPKLVIMDEATSGLDPLMQAEFYKILLEEKKNGTTIFFSTHILREVTMICDRVGIIKNGQLLKVDTTQNIVSNNMYLITILFRNMNDFNEIKNKFRMKLISSQDMEIKLMYDEDINVLLNEINKYRIEKLLIEEPSIEDVFIHYYE